MSRGCLYGQSVGYCLCLQGAKELMAMSRRSLQGDLHGCHRNQYLQNHHQIQKSQLRKKKKQTTRRRQRQQRSRSLKRRPRLKMARSRQMK
ncbi:uncharacterized protein [Salvelinus sp. IW2-2015]|uniref:uncharacterized protein isoform X2 n=1 Tax=Salvelinus sp. IW2-2015 TaxID=2691554 RepID=UPI000CDFD3AB|nr:uncharacterized protein LOC111950414 isoform X2 [Salvelinus alpinus]